MIKSTTKHCTATFEWHWFQRNCHYNYLTTIVARGRTGLFTTLLSLPQEKVLVNWFIPLFLCQLIQYEEEVLGSTSITMEESPYSEGKELLPAVYVEELQQALCGGTFTTFVSISWRLETIFYCAHEWPAAGLVWGRPYLLCVSVIISGR